MKEKIVFIIGGGTGIGKATALLCAKQGAKAIIIGGPWVEILEEAAAEIRQLGSEAMIVQVDVTQAESVDRCFKLIEDKYRCIDTLVNSAGICCNTPYNKISVQEWDLVMRTNLFGSFYTSQKAIDMMAAHGVKGSIVNVSSIAAKLGAGAVGAHYAASKAGVSNVTISAATWAARFGIRVNAVAPGPIQNNMTEDWNKDMSAKLVKTIPLRTFGQSEDVAEAILFLASSKAHYITGQILDVNGGACMG